MIFSWARARAWGEISERVTVALGNAVARAMPMAPEPVPRSRIEEGGVS